MSANNPQRTFECGYHPVGIYRQCFLRLGFDPLESNNELLKGLGPSGLTKKPG